MMNFGSSSLQPAASEAIELPSVGSHIAFLLIVFAIVFVFEVAFPLFAYDRRDRVRNIGRNLVNLYPQFYWNSVAQQVQTAIRYLNVTSSGRQWIANLYSNVFRAERDIALS